MNIIFVAPRVHPNQVPIINGLIQEGHKVTFLVQKKSETEEYGGADVFDIPKTKLCSLFLNLIRLFKGIAYAEEKSINLYVPNRRILKEIISKAKPDVVIIRDINIFSYIAFQINKNGECKYLLYNQAPKYIVDNHQKNGIKKIAKQYIRNKFPNKRITTVRYKNYPNHEDTYRDDENAFFLPFVIRSPSATKELYCEDGVVHLLDSGKYRDYKNHFFLVDAVIKLRNVGYRNFHLTIQGQAVRSDEYEYYNKLKKYIKDHEADDYITLLTGVSYQEMEKLYLRNDIFILVSKNEVANVSILDAMTYGLPVICTSSNGTSDYVLPGESGYVYQAGDIEDLSSKIKKYLDDNTSIQKQGCYAKEYVKKTFGFGNYYKKLVNVIESL